MALGLSALAAAYGIYLAGVLRRPAPTAVRLAAGFAGSAACMECHSEIGTRHAATPHARALHSATDPQVLSALPASRWVRDPDTGFRHQVAQRDKVLGVETDAGGTLHWQPLQWAFGSGTHAITPVGRAADGRYVEAPLTFYKTAGWDFTPGFLGKPASERRQWPSGNLLEGKEVYDCFHCHTAGTARGEFGVEVGGAQFGVQCESCHGPSGAHLSAARAGRPTEGTLNPGQASAQSMVTFCATCHRDQPPPGLKVSDPVVIRFAPVGFQQSACFRKGSREFSCVSCHTPHGETPREPDFFRKVCGDCHGGGKRESPCPVQPGGDCVSCHMPKRIIQRNAIFTDHWIRVVREAAAPPDNARERDAHRKPER